MYTCMVYVQVPLEARRACQITPELELHVVLSHGVVDGNWTGIPFNSSNLLLITRPSLQTNLSIGLAFDSSLHLEFLILVITYV